MHIKRFFQTCMILQNDYAEAINRYTIKNNWNRKGRTIRFRRGRKFFEKKNHPRQEDEKESPLPSWEIFVEIFRKKKSPSRRWRKK